jgi:hypothetical protein
MRASRGSFEKSMRQRRSSMKNGKLSSQRIRSAMQVVALVAAVCSAAKAGEPPSIPIPCNYPSALPTWGTVYNGGILCFLGTDPRIGAKVSIITVPVVPIIVRLLDANGKVAFVSDPTQPIRDNPSSNSALSPWGAVLGSPIFQAQGFKLGETDLGTNQWGEAVEKASFWKFPLVDFKGWHVEMLALPFPALTLSVRYGSWYVAESSYFSALYVVDRSVLDPFLFKFMKNSSPGLMPIFLTYNIEEQQGSSPCCSYSYHNWYKIDGLYTPFIWASYRDSSFSNPDLMPLSHEVAETVHDPFNSNKVPGWPAPFTFPLPWNPSSTFEICQTTANFEVGDPLEDRTSWAQLEFSITNSVMQYHFQNVVTASWLMRSNPSFSVNGWYTLKGAVDGEFAAPAPACPTR